MISADNAHAWHPNYSEKFDPTNHPMLGGGPVIKFNAAQKYASDAVSAAIVHLTVEVDSKIADLQQWALYMKKKCLGIHRILALHDDSTCQGQRTVEPGGHDRTTINFGIQFYDTALAEHLGVRLDAEGRGIAVSTDHVEACIGKRLLSDLEGIDRRVVLGDKELVASLYLAQWLLRIDAAETILLQFIRHVLDSQEIHWRSVKKG